MNTTISAVRIPQITDIKKAIEIYYKWIEIGNQQIMELFGKMSRARLVRLKKLAQAKMIETETICWNATCVNTKAAYAAWGLDISDLEARYKKLRQLNLVG